MDIWLAAIGFSTVVAAGLALLGFIVNTFVRLYEAMDSIGHIWTTVYKLNKKKGKK